MKYCVSGRQPASTLRQADEIKMQYQDRRRLIDYAVEMPEKTYIVEVPKSVLELDLQLFTTLSESTNLILALQDMKWAKTCQENNIKFYWAYPIFSWYELDTVLQYKPSYLFLTAPLCFSLREVRLKTNTPIRLCPNVANSDYLPRNNGLCGPWIRPEDVEVYGQWVDALEFKTEHLEQERTLLKVYKDDKAWPGNLNLLFTDFGINVSNLAIPEGIGERRANCRQRCMEARTCHLCETTIKLADTLRNNYYERLKSGEFTRT